jgi:hypothetical protein
LFQQLAAALDRTRLDPIRYYFASPAESDSMAPTRLITPDHYRGIGEVTATWARLESHVFRTLMTILGLPYMQALTVLWELNYRARIDRLRGLIALRWRGPTDVRKTEFEALIVRMDDAYFIRNLVAHSFWRKGAAENSISPFFVNAKGGKIPRTTHSQFKSLSDRDFTPERLHQEALDIYKLAEDFKLFATLHFKVEFLHGEGDEPLD